VKVSYTHAAATATVCAEKASRTAGSGEWFHLKGVGGGPRRAPFRGGQTGS
jgi:hypothetical protein